MSPRDSIPWERAASPAVALLPPRLLHPRQTPGAPASPTSGAFPARPGEQEAEPLRCALDVAGCELSDEGTQIREVASINTGGLCITLFRRTDGTVLTQDCPVGVQLRQRRRRRIVSAVAVVTALGGVALSIEYFSGNHGSRVELSVPAAGITSDPGRPFRTVPGDAGNGRW